MPASNLEPREAPTLFAAISCPECGHPRMELVEAMAGYRVVLLAVCFECHHEEEVG